MDPEHFRQELAEADRVNQRPGPHHPFRRESGQFQGQPGQGVDRIRDHHELAARRNARDRRQDRPHEFRVPRRHLIAIGDPRRGRYRGTDHHDLASLGVPDLPRPHAHGNLQESLRVHQVQRLALGLLPVPADQHDLPRHPPKHQGIGEHHADGSGTDDRDFHQELIGDRFSLSKPRLSARGMDPLLSGQDSPAPSA